MVARNQNKKVKQAFYLLAFALGMLAMSYAAVPLYKIFCKVTGYGGTPKISVENDSYKIKEKISEFLDESKRYSFHAVVAHVSPTSPCWGHGGIQVGSVITHVNGVPATTDGWDEFCEQMAGAVEKGHLMLKTRLGPKRGLFCAITQ